ncbi:hypothetical protein [uncultured Piscinibacter sp.]|uniref:hypothetical protein n=1 Tax=uncultured Piscinibacter sp. TaxID=1131835 RepID=UPI00262C075D|nr:hypothetical protein [uncultured Piscinibacter sp.]
MTQQSLRIALAFTDEDQTWLRVSSVSVPKFFEGHSELPATGDALRIGGRQFIVQARIWEHDGLSPSLRLLLSSGHAPSDTVFG